MKELYIHLFHVLIVGTLFLYVGIQKSKIPEIMFYVLYALGIIIILYHAYKGYTKILKNKNPWVSLIHILIVGPLLIYIGYNKQSSPRWSYEILLMLGFASIGYHGYYIIEESNN